jgi:hypothetical protein
MKLSNGEKTPQEVAAALNVWARESGEAIKVKIEQEVKKIVSRMGFAKATDLKRLEREVMELRAIVKGKGVTAKKAGKKAAKKKVGKKNVTKKSAAKKMSK